ncbi:MAG: hypothetical protein H7647_01800, partial [Candidatus Heimdallarchaeota archaeon]|nr:hypothetical protein [Candidatus Heimdallarchaeota archaeon]MCK4253162.1 hypothetical protein [Candidatus Heimdallarchaeota archaeon]
FSERKIFRDCTLWNDKPTILYRYAYDDVNNVGLAIYNNSMWEYFETVNINHNSYYELLVCNDTLHVIYGDSGRSLQISEIEFNYQDNTWQEAKQSRIHDDPSYNPICDIENSEVKAIMSTTGYYSTAFYVEEFDVKQLSGYIVMLTVFVLVLVLPNVYIKIKRRLTNTEVFPEKIPL